MAVYKSENVELNASAESVYGKLSNLENLRSLLEKVPADQVPDDKREMFDSIQITPETISVPAGKSHIPRHRPPRTLLHTS